MGVKGDRGINEQLELKKYMAHISDYLKNRHTVRKLFIWCYYSKIGGIQYIKLELALFHLMSWTNICIQLCLIIVKGFIVQFVQLFSLLMDNQVVFVIINNDNNSQCLLWS